MGNQRDCQKNKGNSKSQYSNIEPQQGFFTSIQVFHRATVQVFDTKCQEKTTSDKHRQKYADQILLFFPGEPEA